MKYTRIRRIVQFLSFLLHNIGINFYAKTGIITPALYCYACPLAAFGCPFGVLQHFIALHRIPYYWIGSIGLYTAIGGRSYCGWVCPFGAFQDLIRSYGKRLGLKKLNIKYIFIPSLLLSFFYLFLAYIYEDTVFCKYCPAGTLFGLIPYYVLNPDTPVSIYFYMHILTLILVIIFTMSIDRFWCRYLCPIGIIYGLMNRLSFLTIKIDKNKCTGCKVCLYKCPMNLKFEDIGKSPGCLLCGECISTCPYNALKYSIASRR